MSEDKKKANDILMQTKPKTRNVSYLFCFMSLDALLWHHDIQYKDTIKKNTQQIYDFSHLKWLNWQL
jgi:hypothetical protein